jgi:magnesium chelatase family protein
VSSRKRIGTGKDVSTALSRAPLGLKAPLVRVEVHLGSGLPTFAMVGPRCRPARQVQMQRQGKFNARLTPPEVTQFCGLQRESRVLLGTAISRLGLSARACHRILKLARTCADLAGAPEIRRIDVAEAVQLRALDKLTC